MDFEFNAIAKLIFSGNNLQKMCSKNKKNLRLVIYDLGKLL